MATTKIVLLSDSTAGWFFNPPTPQAFFPEALYDRYGRTIRTATNAVFGGSYSALTTQWFGGGGADEIHLYDAAVGGSNWDDITPQELQVRVTDVQPDFVLIAYGINGGVTGALGLDGLINDVQAAVPSATVVLLSQNPVVTHEATGQGDDNRDIIQGYAATYGLLFVDVYQAFIDYGPDWDPDLVGDGTHPTDAGKQLYADTVEPALFNAGLLGSAQGGSTVAVLDSAEAYYRANRYSGSGDWLDESGNGHDAVPSGSPLWDGEKFTLNGVNQFFTVADADELDPGAGDFTVVVVAAPAAAAGQDLISKRSVGAVPYWDIETNANNNVTLAGVSDGTVIATVQQIGVLTAGIRSTVSSRIIRSTQRIRVGVDGTYGENTFAGGAVASATNLLIGDGVNPSFGGDIYGVAIFTTALTDQEIEQAGQELLIPPLLLLLGVGS